MGHGPKGKPYRGSVNSTDFNARISTMLTHAETFFHNTGKNSHNPQQTITTPSPPLSSILCASLCPSVLYPLCPSVLLDEVHN